MSLFKRKNKNQVTIPGTFGKPKTPDISGPQKVSGNWPLRKKLAILGIAVLALGLIGSGYLYWNKQRQVVAGDASKNLAQTDPKGDVDNDGLTNEQEKYYGSDPLDPDSDNDGYSDGEEVKSSHNPIGAGKLIQKGGSVTGDYSGISLQQVFSGKGSYLCNMSLDQQDTPMKVALKVKGSNIRQEMIPNFPNVSNDQLDPIVLIRNGADVFFGSGENNKGWLKLSYNEKDKSWSSPGVTISGGLFVSPEEVQKANPEKVECESLEIEDSEFAVPAKYIIEPGMTYQQFQDKLKNTK